jgi:hypothetical protein
MAVLHEVRQGSFGDRLSELEVLVTNSPGDEESELGEHALLQHLKDTALCGSPTGTGKPILAFLFSAVSLPNFADLPIACLSLFTGEYSSSMSAISAISNSPSFPPPLLTRIAALEVLVTGHKAGAVGRLIPRLETLEMAAFERVQQGDLPKRVLQLENMLLGGRYL